MGIKGLDCIVLGAGIGGLAVATALARRGARVRVFEQAEALREVGAGLQVSPNGAVVLRALGVGAAMDEAATTGEAVQLTDYRGAPVLRLDLNRSRFGGFKFLHRADLLSVLEDAARAARVEIMLSHKAISVSPGTPPVVQLLDGSAHRAQLVIGADGLHSVARSTLNGNAAPFFTGQVAWRATVPETESDPKVTVWMGPHRHLVSYTLRGGTLRNLVAVQEKAAWVAESWSQRDTADAVQSAFADFAPEVTSLLSRVEEVNQWGLFRHPVAPRWYADNIALLGDAAHPTLPFLAQGANMALEDAWALASCLDTATDVQTGLAAYQSQRQARTMKIVAAANKNAWRYHLAFPPLRWSAHTAMRVGGAIAPRLFLKQFDWIYGYDVTQVSGV